MAQLLPNSKILKAFYSLSKTWQVLSSEKSWTDRVHTTEKKKTKMLVKI